MAMNSGIFSKINNGQTTDDFITASEKAKADLKGFMYYQKLFSNPKIIVEQAKATEDDEPNILVNSTKLANDFLSNSGGIQLIRNIFAKWILEDQAEVPLTVQGNFQPIIKVGKFQGSPDETAEAVITEADVEIPLFKSQKQSLDVSAIFNYFPGGYSPSVKITDNVKGVERVVTPTEFQNEFKYQTNLISKRIPSQSPFRDTMFVEKVYLNEVVNQGVNFDNIFDVDITAAGFAKYQYLKQMGLATDFVVTSQQGQTNLNQTMYDNSTHTNTNNNNLSFKPITKDLKSTFDIFEGSPERAKLLREEIEPNLKPYLKLKYGLIEFEKKGTYNAHTTEVELMTADRDYIKNTKQLLELKLGQILKKALIAYNEFNFAPALDISSEIAFIDQVKVEFDLLGSIIYHDNFKTEQEEAREFQELETQPQGDGQ